MSDHYILDGKTPVAVDLMTWAKWLDDPSKKRVAQDYIGDYWISTVFLGLDHRFSDDGPPILFETMVFPEKGKNMSEKWAERACTWDEALAAHERGCQWARENPHD